jgi:hypothetical protein
MMLSLIVNCVHNMHDWSDIGLDKIVPKFLTSLVAKFIEHISVSYYIE